jgi:hypothetical protein
MEKQKLASLILRIGIAFSFTYAAVSSFINPTAWIGFLPRLIQLPIILTTFSIIQLILSLFLILDKKTYYVSIISSLLFTGMIIFNLGALDIIFRDITILLASIALSVLSRN